MLREPLARLRPAPLSVTAMFSLAVTELFAQSAESYLSAYDLGAYHLDDQLEALP